MNTRSRFILFVLAIISINMYAQDTTVYMDGIWQPIKVEFIAPDASYIKTSDDPLTYFNDALSSTVTYTTIPVTFEEALPDFKAAESDPTRKMILKENFTVGELQCFLMKYEVFSPDIEYENYYVLTLLVPNGNHAVNLVAAYPVSHEAALYPKMIACFKSMKIIIN